MPQLTFSILFNDTKNFIRNNFGVVVIVLVVLSTFSALVTQLLTPTEQAFAPVQTFLDNIMNRYGQTISPQIIQQDFLALPPKEQEFIFSAMINYLISLMIVSVVTTLVTSTVIIALIDNLSKGLGLQGLITSAIRFVLPMILFMLLSLSLLALLSMVGVIITPLMIPVIFIAILVYTLYSSVFIGILAVPTEDMRFQAKLKDMLKIVKKRFSLVSAIMFVWLAAIIGLTLITAQLSASGNIVINILIGIVSLLFSVFMYAYYYRLWSLENKKI